ncbi:MAG: molybdopterin molybdotransferase MoeA [Candidatus Bathyarchaeum sp.]|nr:MAG: molybdopterin molybdotransferase MoeA [Candidatus Bathyarchaeum sp.]
MARLKGFQKLTNIDTALSSFLEQLKPERLDSERIPIHAAQGRVTAEETRAQYHLPPFDRSAVDGYALRAKDTFGVTAFNPKILKLTENKVRENEAREIWTGNPVPEGADAIVMLEYTKKLEDKIEVGTAVTPGENVSKRGEDVTKGDVAIKAQTRLNPHHLGLLAALSETHVDVVRKPKVAILSTGNELVELGQKLEHGQIVETNQLIFSSMCRELGAEPRELGITKDNLKEITAKIKEGLDSADAIITTGGTSVGYPDLVPTAINQLGKPGVIVHGVAMRPGMPTALAILKCKPIFILSGNPVAATIGFEVFVRPLLLRLQGIKKEPRPAIQAKLTRRVAAALGRRVFLRVRVFERDGSYFAEPVRVKGSGVLTTMTKANGYVIIPENREGLEDGETVMVHLFYSIEGE